MREAVSHDSVVPKVGEAAIPGGAELLQGDQLLLVTVVSVSLLQNGGGGGKKRGGVNV